MWRYLILTSNEVAAGCQTLVHVASVLEGVDGEDQPHQYHEQADDGEGGHCPLVVCEMKDGKLRKCAITVHEKMLIITLFNIENGSPTCMCVPL